MGEKDYYYPLGDKNMGFISKVELKYQLEKMGIKKIFANKESLAGLNTKDKQLITKLEKLLENEHIHGCDQNSCDINFAFQEGYTLWAIELFSGTAAASKNFERLYAQLSPNFKKEAEAERKLMVKEPHTECPHCNAVLWGDDEYDYCNNCGENPSKK